MTLEDRVSNLERNVDAVVGALEQITQALRGISARQDEHSEAIRSIMATQNDHSRTLAEHSEAIQAVIAVQNEHSEALRAATGILNEHTRILLEDSVDIQFIKNMLAALTNKPTKSLMRMFGPTGNPNARNLFEAISHIQRHEGIQLEVTAVR